MRLLRLELCRHLRRHRSSARGETVAVDVINMVGRGLLIVGTNQGDAVPRVFIPQLIELYRRGRLPVDRIVTCFPLADINKAAEASLNGSVIKPVLLM